jgi:hypothetical protein
LHDKIGKFPQLTVGFPNKIEHGWFDYRVFTMYFDNDYGAVPDN